MIVPYLSQADVAGGSLSDLSRFRTRAVIDWIQLEIETAETTNFQTVQDRLRATLRPRHNPTVTALEAGPGGAARRFRITLQEPKDDLLPNLDRFRDVVPLTSEPTVEAIELAVDFYSKAQDHAELQEMTMRLKKSLRAQGAVELQCGPGLTERLEDALRLRDGWTLVIRDGEVQWRVYLKQTDRNVPLPVAEHRARVEVTLRGDRIPDAIATVARLRLFDLGKIARLFAFRQVLPPGTVRPPTTPAELALQRRQELVANKGHRELAVPKRRKHAPGTRADIRLKQRARDALRELSRRLRAGKPGRNKSNVIESAGEGDLALITKPTSVLAGAPGP